MLWFDICTLIFTPSRIDRITTKYLYVLTTKSFHATTWTSRCLNMMNCSWDTKHPQHNQNWNWHFYGSVQLNWIVVWRKNRICCSSTCGSVPEISKMRTRKYLRKSLSFIQTTCNICKNCCISRRPKWSCFTITCVWIEEWCKAILNLQSLHLFSIEMELSGLGWIYSHLILNTFRFYSIYSRVFSSISISIILPSALGLWTQSLTRIHL